MNENVQEVIEFWKFLEILQTKSFYPEKDEKEKKKNRKCKVIKNENDLIQLEQENNNFSDYDFCCYSIKKSIIEEYFIKEKSIDEKRLEISKEYICLFGFQVDCNFNYNQQVQSFYVSPYIWYLNEILQNNSSSFNDYKEFNDSLKNQKIKNIFENEKLNLLEKIEQLKELIFNKISLLKLFNDNGNIKDIIAAYYSKTNYNSFVEHESQLFNSYIIDDLELVSKNLSQNKNVTEYILSLTREQGKTIDVKKDYEEIFRILSKDKYPLGKWPSKFFPALMQQMAVNYAIEKNRNPFFSVNGPPGTGKTSLLKEIIADTIVKRAIKISELSTSDDAFKKNIINGVTFYKLNEAFLEYSILVASCNNAAVENITKDLPEGKELLEDLKEKHKPYAVFFDINKEQEKLSYKNNKDEDITDTYFNQLEADYCNYKKDKEAKEISKEDVWGCISAPLGNKNNIDRFFNTIISDYLDLMDESLVNEKIRQNLFKEAKQEFNDQLKIVQQELEKLDSNVTTDYVSRIINKDEEVQTSRPSNLTDKYDLEREILFCKAINLQKAFVLTSTCLSQNLLILRKCFITPDDKDGRLSETQKYSVFTDCFLSLFFLVPVISSTFASIQKMFRYITEPKKIGTLIIDEAGQATPQQALGAIFRSQKFVIVGDPMQVEPVVTTSPEVYEDFLNDNFSSFIERYVSSIKSESVQTYADRLNPYGSYIESQRNLPPVWVGCPLIVHRRCISPMFNISNELSYGGTMINSTKIEEKDFLLPDSYWIDINGKENGNKNHFIKEQYDAVRSLLEQKKNTSDTTIFIITPFVSVKSGFKNIKDIEDIQLGTVHTFQGKEADEVFLVLGCDETSKPAVQWVNANIINVAVTRAKYRLYVIGDWNLWTSNKNVSVMQKFLTRKEITDFIPEKTQEKKTMSEIIKDELLNISKKIEQMENDAYEEGRESAFIEIAEKMKKEKISSDVIERITGIKFNDTYTYDDFLDNYPEVDYSISVSFNDPWANFKINDDSFGWNVDEKRFGRINDTKLSQDFLDDFKTLLSSLSVEQIEEYWGSILFNKNL